MKLPADLQMRDYLLGRLYPAELESVRESIFAREEAWERLLEEGQQKL